MVDPLVSLASVMAVAYFFNVSPVLRISDVEYGGDCPLGQSER